MLKDVCWVYCQGLSFCLSSFCSWKLVAANKLADCLWPCFAQALYQSWEDIPGDGTHSSKIFKAQQTIPGEELKAALFTLHIAQVLTLVCSFNQLLLANKPNSTLLPLQYPDWCKSKIFWQPLEAALLFILHTAASISPSASGLWRKALMLTPGLQ